jgi:phytoene desaturase
MPDPSLLVSVPSIDEPSMAPDGCSVLYVLEPTPNLDGIVDWTVERPRARDQLAAKVAALGYGDAIDVEMIVDPLEWQRQGMERGTPFALSHRFFQTGPFRPSNIDKRAPGLVFAGSSTVPGVGVPMVLISGRLAADRVDRLAP